MNASHLSHRLLAFGAAVLLQAAALGAATGEPLSLEEALRLALENNPRLRAQSERLEAGAGRAAQLRRWSNPELSFEAEDWPRQGGRGFRDAKQTVGISQTIPLPGKKALDREIGAAAQRGGQAGLEAFRLELRRELKIAYGRVLVAERSLEVTEKLHRVAAEAARAAQGRVRAGAGALQEQLRAELLEEQAGASVTEQRSALGAARGALATLLGQDDLGERPLTGKLPETADETLLRAAEGGLGRHPSLGAAEAERDRTEMAHRRARLETVPDPSVGLSAGRVGSTGESIIGVRISVPLPILDGGAARRQETRAEANAAVAELRATRQALERERATALQRYRLALQQCELFRTRLLPKSGEATRLVSLGFEQGKFGINDLLETQRTHSELQLGHLGKLQELNEAQATLEALCGAATTTGAAPDRQG